MLYSTLRRNFQWMLGGLLVTSLSLAAQESPTFEGVLAVYEANRKADLPNYITQDLLLVAYQQLARQQDRALEQKAAAAFSPWLAQLHSALDATPAQSASSARQFLEDWLAVLTTLAGDSGVETASDIAREEIDLVKSAEGIAQSPLWQSKVDYSQFKPRGDYAEDPAQSRYFVMSRYLNSTRFYLRASSATGVTGETVALHMDALALLADMTADSAPYQALVAPVMAGGGRVDDLYLQDVWTLREEACECTLAEQLTQYAEKQDRKPRVIQGYVDRSLLAKDETAADVMLAVTVIPGLAFPDSVAFQLLTGQSGHYTGKAETPPFTAAEGSNGLTRGYPMANDVLALLGSQSAQDALAASGDTDYKDYDAARAAAETQFSALVTADASWWALLTQVAASGAQGNLETARAFWTLQKHRQLLHSKQSYTLVDRSFSIPANRPGASVEPVPGVFQALLELVRARQNQVEALAQWQSLDEIITQCLALATRVEKGDPLSDDDEYFLNDLDRQLKALAIVADKPVVVDVHTHPGEGKVLQEATGWARVVWHQAESGKARGAKLSHREFKHDLADRLTDQAWRKQLQADSDK